MGGVVAVAVEDCGVDDEADEGREASVFLFSADVVVVDVVGVLLLFVFFLLDDDDFSGLVTFEFAGLLAILRRISRPGSRIAVVVTCSLSSPDFVALAAAWAASRSRASLFSRKSSSAEAKKKLLLVALRGRRVLVLDDVPEPVSSSALAHPSWNFLAGSSSC